MMEDTILEAEAADVSTVASQNADPGLAGESNGADTGALAKDETDGKEEESEQAEEAIDYAAVAAEDLSELRAQFPALRALPSLAALADPVRYAELREMGLSPKEAYLAIGGTARRKSDNRSHLLSSVPRSSALAENLPSGEEMAEARRLFSNLSDAQIHRLYKKVTN